MLYVVRNGADEITPGQGGGRLIEQNLPKEPVGLVDYHTGKVALFDRSDADIAKLYGKTGESFTVNNKTHTSDFPTDPIEFRFKPASDNVVARRRSIIDIDVTKSTITVEKDAIKYLGSKGASEFDTIQRIDPDFDL